jgi:hypothetical protein
MLKDVVRRRFGVPMVWSIDRLGRSIRTQGKELLAKVAAVICEHLSVGHGILKVVAMVGVGSGTAQRVNREMAGRSAGMPGSSEPMYGAACLYPPIAREGRGMDINNCTTRCRPAPTCHP